MVFKKQHQAGETEVTGDLFLFITNHLTMFRRNLFFIITALFSFTAAAAEYEVSGTITQTITNYNAPVIRSTADFTIFVRDCSWLIQTTETNSEGVVNRRETACTNGAEIVDCLLDLPNLLDPNAPGPAGRKNSAAKFHTAMIISNNIPVGFLDISVVGHLWLMFASQCYWSKLTSDSLIPVYDWHASAGIDPDLRLNAEWELLGGKGSLPREVRYLEGPDRTNGFYKATGTISAGETLIPSGFVFEERRLRGPGMEVVRKRVEAHVTSVQAKCSRVGLLPMPQSRTIVMDYRLTQPGTNHIPTYTQPGDQSWLSVDKARRLAAANSQRRGPQRPSRIFFGVICGLLLAPILFFIPWKRSQMRQQS